VLDPAVVEALGGVAAAAGVTMNIVVQAAWAIVLGRCASESDVVIGVTRRCRHGGLADANAIVGPMINTVPVRADVSTGRPVAELLRSLSDQWSAARPHEHAPTARIQSWSAVPPGTPLFESIVVFESTILDDTLPVDADGALRRRIRHLAQTHFPLTFVADAGSTFRLKIEYDRSLFGSADVAHLLERAALVLSGIAAGDAASIGALPLLPADERALVVHRWNTTQRDYAPLAAGRCLHDLIEAQCARTPAAVAVVAEDGSAPLTYGGLAARTTALSAWLRNAGVGPGVLVGVCLERSVDLVVALVAILRAGGAYVPLDAGYPADRLGFMLADSGVAVLLTQSRLRERLDAAVAAAARTDVEGAALPVPPRTLCLDTGWDAVDAASAKPAAPAASGVRASDPAYMIYTSGSTGRPKGALNAHAGIVNRLCWMQEEYGLSATDAVLQKTPASFDVSVWEFFWPLMTGATLVVARPGGHRDPAYLSDLIQRAGVTVLHFVPSMLRAFLTAPEVQRLGPRLGAALRHVICSGEALGGELQAQAFATLGPALALHNLYGPTECAVDVTAWRCRPQDPAQAPVPIGRPIANTQVYVLDPQGQPLPVGVAGELYLGGVQVGLGYHRRPALTAERFVADPFAPPTRPGARLYRTGDRARWRADGVVEYLGRLDDQVKLRGLRIELGEIETTLRRAPGLHDAAVVVREDVPGDQRLVAYVVAVDAAGIDPVAIRRHLSASLPEYMVPSAFVTLASLPLGASGKLDRRALPAPTPDAPADDAAPVSGVEAVVAAVWSDILGLPRIGATRSFFELGGHSLLATQVVARLSRIFQGDLPLRTLFEHPTVRDFAQAIVAREAQTGRAERIAAVWQRMQSMSPEERRQRALAATGTNDKADIS
jgi:amino acid adenylation domain-containing protein